VAAANISFVKRDDGVYQLNAVGYGCPHVQIYTEKALKKLSSGEELEIVFDNPSSGSSIAFICKVEGHALTEDKNDAGTFTWRIRKA
jgi:tRNA 2-thiouridine synthesizing protein A